MRNLIEVILTLEFSLISLLQNMKISMQVITNRFLNFLSYLFHQPKREDVEEFQPEHSPQPKRRPRDRKYVLRTKVPGPDTTESPRCVCISDLETRKLWQDRNHRFWELLLDWWANCWVWYLDEESNVCEGTRVQGEFVVRKTWCWAPSKLWSGPWWWSRGPCPWNPSPVRCWTCGRRHHARQWCWDD